MNEFEIKLALTPEEKVSILERILLSIYRGEEIKYNPHQGVEYGYLTIIDIKNIGDINEMPTLAGYEGEGLSMNFEPEVYEGTFPMEMGMTDKPIPCARLNLEIWWSPNLWDRIEELEKEVKELQGGDKDE